MSYTIPCGSKTHSSKRPPYCYVILRRVTAGQRELCPSIRLTPVFTYRERLLEKARVLSC